MKVVMTYDYGREARDRLEQLGYKVVVIPEREIENGELLNDADVLACYNPFGQIKLRDMKNLKWIQLSSIGFDQIPASEVLARKIIITNNHGGYSKPIGEWIVMNLLETFKERRAIHHQQDQKIWKLNSGVLELVDRTIGFLGTGSLAIEGAKRLSGFEVKCVGFNTRGTATQYFDACYDMDHFESWLPQLDALIITVPYTAKTHHLMNEERLGLMADNSVLINVSRGSVIHEEALIKHLGLGKFKGVALDVFEEEPLKDNSPLWEFERVYISAHNCWFSEKRNTRRFEMIYENMRRFIKGEPLEHVVNIERGY